jgi:hypothetical protein
MESHYSLAGTLLIAYYAKSVMVRPEFHAGGGEGVCEGEEEVKSMK